MTQSAEIKDLAASLAKAQGQMTGAKKDSDNPFFKSKYADLAAVWDAIRGPLSINGLSVVQTTAVQPDGLVIHTMLLHSSGQFISGEMPVRAVKNDSQGMGSAITYSRRYALQAMVGVAPEDDDGNAASGIKQNQYSMSAMQPEKGDGIPDESYRIPFGKFARRSLEEVGFEELRSYVEYIESKAAKDKKPISGQVLDFVERASHFISAFENAPLYSGDPQEG